MHFAGIPQWIEQSELQAVVVSWNKQMNSLEKKGYCSLLRTLNAGNDDCPECRSSLKTSFLVTIRLVQISVVAKNRILERGLILDIR